MSRTMVWLRRVGLTGLLMVTGSVPHADAQPPELGPGPGRDMVLHRGPSAWAEDDADGGDPGLAPEHGEGVGPGGGGRGHVMGRPVPRSGMRGPGWMGARLAELDLSASQRKRIADIRDRQERQDIQARADLQIARLDLGKLMRAESPDLRAIEAQIDRVGAMRSDRDKARVTAMLDLRSVLSDEQRRKLRQGRPASGRDGGDEP